MILPEEMEKMLKAAPAEQSGSWSPGSRRRSSRQARAEERRRREPVRRRRHRRAQEAAAGGEGGQDARETVFPGTTPAPLRASPEGGL